MAKLIVELPDETHKALKKKAVGDDKSMRDVVTTLIEGYLSTPSDQPANSEVTGLCGAWQDDREAGEIIASLKQDRKWFGRGK